MPFRLTCFGVGDGAACADRNHSSFLYSSTNGVILLDSGEPISRTYKASGLSCELVDRIVLSHLHFDHIGGLFMLLQGLWLEQRTKELTIHLPESGIEPIRNLLRAGYLFDELLEFKIEFAPLKASRSFEVHGIKVTPYHNTHLAAFARSFGEKYPTGYESFSFLLEADGARVVHSADLGVPEDLEPVLARPVDLLVCELAHFEPETLFEYLRGKALKRIAFVHLGRPYHENLTRTRKTASRMLPGVELLFPTDLEEIELERVSATSATSES